MKKIIIIGCPGSGKTTFAEKLRSKTGLSLYYLDAVWHNPDKTHISRDDFDSRMSEILAEDSWIIDGNYQRTIESRIIACDTIILFDLPTELCIEGALSRIGKERYDIPWVDTELDPRFRMEIENFKDQNLPIIYDLIDKHKKDKSVVIFRSREDSDKFIHEKLKSEI